METRALFLCQVLEALSENDLRCEAYCLLGTEARACMGDIDAIVTIVIVRLQIAPRALRGHRVP
jgi:tagatose-1,6-bisphosphate aldolase non-catalytic subunit AgaZ/GatZ